MSENARPRVVTPMVLIAGVVVAVVGAANIFLAPELTTRWVLGILFLPAMILLIRLLLRNPKAARRIGGGGGIRAGLVGAGVALAAAFSFSFTDQMGWTSEDNPVTSGPLWVFLLAGIAIGVDVLGSRLQAKASEDPED